MDPATWMEIGKTFGLGAVFAVALACAVVVMFKVYIRTVEARFAEQKEANAASIQQIQETHRSKMDHLDIRVAAAEKRSEKADARNEELNRYIREDLATRAAEAHVREIEYGKILRMVRKHMSGEYPAAPGDGEETDRFNPHPHPPTTVRKAT